MPDKYIISVNKKNSTGEWLASVNKNGRFYEPGTAYQDDPEDAVNTAIATIERTREAGDIAELSDAIATREMVQKYRPDWLLKEARTNDLLGALKTIQTRNDCPCLNPGGKELLDSMLSEKISITDKSVVSPLIVLREQIKSIPVCSGRPVHRKYHSSHDVEEITEIAKGVIGTNNALSGKAGIDSQSPVYLVPDASTKPQET